MEFGRAHSKVAAYSIGFGVVEKQAFVHYWLEGDAAAHSLDVSAPELTMLADMFRNEVSLSYDHDRQCLVSARELVGHGVDQPHPMYP